MKAYGLPRNKCVECPDLADIAEYGLASHRGRKPNRNGECKSTSRSSKNKRDTRRYWKRVARAYNKSLCEVIVDG